MKVSMPSGRAHGWGIAGEGMGKISKSRGTAVWIEDYLKTFDPDPLRYYLTAVAPENQRTTFDVDEFLTKHLL